MTLSKAENRRSFRTGSSGSLQAALGRWDGISLETEVSYWRSNRALHGLKDPGSLALGIRRSNFHLVSKPSWPIRSLQGHGREGSTLSFIPAPLSSIPLALPAFFTPWVPYLEGLRPHIPAPDSSTSVRAHLALRSLL